MTHVIGDPLPSREGKVVDNDNNNLTTVPHYLAASTTCLNPRNEILYPATPSGKNLSPSLLLRPQMTYHILWTALHPAPLELHKSTDSV